MAATKYVLTPGRQYQRGRDCGAEARVSPPIPADLIAKVVERAQGFIREYQVCRNAVVTQQTKGKSTVFSVDKMHSPCTDPHRDDDYHKNALLRVAAAGVLESMQKFPSLSDVDVSSLRQLDP